ncbi:MAG: 3-hydroxyacyl-CoA dehydrogenase family protein [Actinomycetota bacterium]|nr:3-hydroxyacyl-CoA dehydrogenase family protein [Actinomycetota bacterium]
MFVFKAAVVGAGTMGGEIAQVIAAADIPVVLKDVEQRFIDQGVARAREVTEGRLSRLVDKQRLTREEADTQLRGLMGRIHGSTTYDAFGDVDFVVEAVPERMEIKQAVFAELDAVTPGHAILASNTSSLSISEMAETTTRPHQVVGFHFFYPASMMRLIEVIEGDESSPETMQTAVNFAQTIRKMPIRCGEAPGFVGNRIAMSAISEIWRVQEEDGASVQEMDQSVQESRVLPMGPFFLTDMLGLDTVLKVAEQLRDCYGDRIHVHSGMRELVAAGNLGQKTGKGFYEHGS